jgi:D-tyrosyl-tRNA(Tyr) deacylase
MRALVQRVFRASVSVAGETTGAIDRGLLVFLGVAREDTETEIEYLSRKIVGLRVFEDEAGRMNRSVVDVGGSILLVSQFTLYGDVRRGRRPGFDRAAPPDVAERLYLMMRDSLGRVAPVETGRFGAKMAVELINDGPATFWIDTADR